MSERIVFGYDGSLDASTALAAVVDRPGTRVVTVTLDVGQGGALDDVRTQALAIGAERAHVIDVRDRFAHEFVLPALRAGVCDPSGDPLAAALARPLIASELITIARIEGASTIAHGASDESTALDVAIHALEPDMRVLGPSLAAPATSRSATRTRPRTARPTAAGRLRARGLHVPDAGTANTNLWGRSRRVVLDADGDDARAAADVESALASAGASPDSAATVEIEFEQGAPARINGVEMPLVDLIQSLETIAAVHAVGRGQRVERRGTTALLHEFDAPAAVVLHTAHRALRELTLPADLRRVMEGLSAAYADAAGAGRWFSPLRGAIDAMVAHLQPLLSGSVRLSLFKGVARVAGRRAAGASSLEPGGMAVAALGKRS